MRKFEVTPLNGESLTVEADEFAVSTASQGQFPIQEARFYREEVLPGTQNLKANVLVHYVRTPATIKEVEQTVGGPAFSPTLDQPEYADLPPRFWTYIATGQKIQAIKELRNASHLKLVAAKQIVDKLMPSAPAPEYRELPTVFWDYIGRGLKIHAIKELRKATGLSLKSAKEIVDVITTARPGTPRVAEVYQVSFLADLPVGTVIRVRGRLGDRDSGQYTGYVFEKDTVNAWITTGVDEDEDFTDDQIRNGSPDGWDVLYVPKEG